MKILGVLTVIGSCLGIGWGWVRAQRQEMLALQALARGVRAIRAELAGRLCPTTELLSCAAERAGEDAEVFFRSCAESMQELNDKCFAELWTEACRTNLAILSEDNRSQLEALGATLGRYELDEQLAACDRYLRSCDEAADARKARLPEQRRLCFALSGSAGIFLCLLIL